MDVPLELAFHGISQSDALETLVHARTDKLEKHFDRIVSCHVVIEAPHRDSERDIRSARVRVDVRVPGKEFIAVSEPLEHEYQTNDVYSAVDAAFDKMERQIRDYTGAMTERRDARYPTEPNGIVVSVDATEDSGYVELTDGREVYFSAASVEGKTIGELEPGDDVKVVLGSGQNSPYPVARRVRVPRRAR